MSNKIQRSWGYVYGVNYDLPNTYITGSSCTYWVSNTGKIGSSYYMMQEVMLKMNSVKVFKISRLDDFLFNDIRIVIEPKIQSGLKINGQKVKKETRIENGRCDIFLREHNIHLCFEAFCDVSDNDSLLAIGDNYKYIMLLGKGGFGYVYKALNVDQEKLCAIKMPLDNDKPHLIKEYRILTALDHDNIIKIMDFVDVPGQRYLVTELAEGGSLYERIKNNYISEASARHIFKQLFLALEYLHNCSFLHRDLKPENIVLMTRDEMCVAKLIDFGVSCAMDDPYEMRRLVGAYRYMAPEILKKKLVDKSIIYEDKVDIWGIGISLFMTMTSTLPFEYTSNLMEYKNRMERRKMSEPVSYQELSLHTRKLLKLTLAINPFDRPTSSELVVFKWNIGRRSSASVANSTSTRNSTRNSMRASGKFVSMKT